MTRLTSLIFVAAFFAGCGGTNHPSTAGQFCPCAPGFSCDTTTNMCVVPAAVDASCSATARPQPARWNRSPRSAKSTPPWQAPSKSALMWRTGSQWVLPAM